MLNNQISANGKHSGLKPLSQNNFVNLVGKEGTTPFPTGQRNSG